MELSREELDLVFNALGCYMDEMLYLERHDQELRCIDLRDRIREEVHKRTMEGKNKNGR